MFGKPVSRGGENGAVGLQDVQFGTDAAHLRKKCVLLDANESILSSGDGQKANSG